MKTFSEFTHDVLICIYRQACEEPDILIAPVSYKNIASRLNLPVDNPTLHFALIDLGNDELISYAYETLNEDPENLFVYFRIKGVKYVEDLLQSRKRKFETGNWQMWSVIVAILALIAFITAELTK